MRRVPVLLSLALAVGLAAGAQTGSPTPTDSDIAAAVLPLPEEFRASATVLAHGAGGAMRTLRAGDGPFICLAPQPDAERFHVACYHRSLEPFMARGRVLRAQGVTGDQVDTVRFAEVRAGTLRMPSHPAALYSLTGPKGSYDAARNSALGARPLFVIYVPGATVESTGLSARPAEGTPWLMFPGTPKAHIMLVPRM